MEGELSIWIDEQLSKLLGFDATSDISSYLLSMDNKSDLEEYLQDLLDTSNTRHKRFVDELLKRWRPKMREVIPSVPEGVTVYQKDSQPESSSVKVSKVKSKAVTEHSTITVHRVSNASPTPCKQKSPKLTVQESPKSTTPKTKYVPLFGADGKDKSVVQIPGRHPCVCQGHKHGLINNCLSCGRVVCKQEGSGPCVFCGTLVCTEEELEILSRGSKKSEKLEASLMKGVAVPKFPPQDEAQSKKAKEHKDKLLNYDKTSARRTKVIDDESDYYATDNKWLSDKQRIELQKKKDTRHSILHGSRRDKKITFDFAGRRLVDSSAAEELAVLEAGAESGFGGDITNLQEYYSGSIMANPSYLSGSEKPQFQIDDSLLTTSAENTLIKPPTSKRDKLRLQDKGLQEVVDNGMCMSMHQPWASLLVAGIKIHEGRSWYSAHRGRLWIAATAQPPSELETEALQASYTARLGRVHFPAKYPISCLLGCVDIVDVLPQEEYRIQFPDGESSSPYVFICDNPQELSLKFPIKGQHKIYKLDSQIHKAAKMGLQIADR